MTSSMLLNKFNTLIDSLCQLILYIPFLHKNVGL